MVSNLLHWPITTWLYVLSRVMFMLMTRKIHVLNCCFRTNAFNVYLLTNYTSILRRQLLSVDIYTAHFPNGGALFPLPSPMSVQSKADEMNNCRLTNNELLR